MSTFSKPIERPRLKGGGVGVGGIPLGVGSARPIIAEQERAAAKTQADFDAARKNALSIFQDEQAVKIRGTLTDLATRHPDDPAALSEKAKAALGPIISGAREVSPVVAASLANSADSALNELVAKAGVKQAARVRDEARAGFLSAEQDMGLASLNAASGISDADPTIRSASAANLLRVSGDYQEALSRSGYSAEEQQKRLNGFRENALAAAFMGAINNAGSMRERVAMLEALDAGTLSLSVETPNGRADFPIGAAIPPDRVAPIRAQAARRLSESFRLQEKSEKDARRQKRERQDENALALFEYVAMNEQPGPGEERPSPEIQVAQVRAAVADGSIRARDGVRMIEHIKGQSLSTDVPEAVAQLWTDLNGGVLTAEAVQYAYTGRQITRSTFGMFMQALKSDASAEARTEWQALSKTIAPPGAFNFRTEAQNARLSEVRREWEDALGAISRGESSERPRNVALRIQEREKARAAINPGGPFANIGRGVDWVVRDANGEPDVRLTKQRLDADKATLPRDVWKARAAYIAGEMSALFPPKPEEPEAPTK